MKVKIDHAKFNQNMITVRTATIRRQLGFDPAFQLDTLVVEFRDFGVQQLIFDKSQNMGFLVIFNFLGKNFRNLKYDIIKLVVRNSLTEVDTKILQNKVVTCRCLVYIVSMIIFTQSLILKLVGWYVITQKQDPRNQPNQSKSPYPYAKSLP